MIIEIEITQGNLDNNHFYLPQLSFFPDAVIGAGSKKDGEGQLIKLHVDGLGVPIQTDIDGKKRIFRKRGWVGDFYRAHNAAPGDFVIIEKQDDYTYRVRFRKV